MKKQESKKEMLAKNQGRANLIDFVDKANTCCNHLATIGTLLSNQRDNPVDKIDDETNLFTSSGLMIVEEVAQLRDLINKLHTPPSI